MTDPTKAERAWVALADGTLFEGVPFGARDVALGEAVFTTTMTGYQEVLTDPSFAGQAVVMTSPEIGNVGVNALDAESLDERPHAAAFVVRSLSPRASNHRSEEELGPWLARHGVVGVSEVDTRALVRHLRDHGAQSAAVGVGDPDELVRRARALPGMAGRDLVREVTPKEAYRFALDRAGFTPLGVTRRAAGFRAVVIDYGTKRNILRSLVEEGAELTVVPASTTAAEVLALRPDGVFLSNGPGDPAVLDYAIATVRGLLGKAPIHGICLGHQLLALALGARTYKLKFGHRGANQPVKDLATGRVLVTMQNHGFCVDEASLPAGLRATHVHLNDGTNEGVAAPDLRAASVQFHPEAAAGPHDATPFFAGFRAAVGSAAAAHGA